MTETELFVLAAIERERMLRTGELVEYQTPHGLITILRHVEYKETE